MLTKLGIRMTFLAIWLPARAKLPGAKLPPEPAFDPDNKWMVIESHRRFQDQVEAARPAASGGPVVSVESPYFLASSASNSGITLNRSPTRP